MKELLNSIFDMRTTRLLATASAICSAIFLAGLVWFSFKYRFPNTFDRGTLAELHDQIKKEPQRKDLIERLRQQDELIRQKFYESRQKLQTGAYLLLVCLIVFTLSMKRVMALSARPPFPVRKPERRQVSMLRKRSLVCVVSVFVPMSILAFGGIFLVRIHQEKPVPPSPTTPLVPGGAPDVTFVPEEYRWAGLRGSDGRGAVGEMELPLRWDARTGENILWRTTVPLPGNSSPIIWGAKLFLTGADRSMRKVFCFDRFKGNLLWECLVRTQARLGADFEVHEDTGLSAPTAATDGKLIFAFFGTAELCAVDFRGNQVWAKWFGTPDSIYGIASSPIVYKGLLYLQLDQGGCAEDGKSFLYALDAKTGKEVWRVPRDVPNSWSTPIIIESADRTQLITCADPWVISYDPETGSEWWRAKVLSGDVAPLPTYEDGIVYAVTQYAQLSAIKADGDGDVTESKVLWTYEDDLSEVSAPLTDGKFLLMANGDGVVTCLDAKTGRLFWRKQFEEGFWSSPVFIGRKVFLTDLQGKTYIFELRDKFKLLGTGEIGEKVVTTPAFVDSRIYIRAKEHLFCIGSK